MLILNTSIVSESAINALHLCFSKLIPSIFPYMIVSSILVKTGIIQKVIARKNQKILGIDKSIFEIVLNSWISGFLIGPKFLSKLHPDKDFTSYYVLSSNAGVGFVISFVGYTLWNSVKFGVFLYITQVISSVIIFKISNNQKLHISQNEKSTSPFLSAISLSVHESTKSMLDICGFTVFFLILKNIIISLIKTDDINLIAFLSAIIEISGGAVSSISSSNIVLCAFFTGFSVGFGGFCMCFQVFSLCSNCMINKKSFIFKKLIHGVVCGCLSSIFVSFTNITPVNSVALIQNTGLNTSSIVLSTVFLYFSMLTIKKSLNLKINSL